ncbi:MAG: hypothetical protein CL608_00495 [Anaerolineaceae bacterium]|nr:hypothetical protein [Anaerolineaceae bacterium]
MVKYLLQFFEDLSLPRNRQKFFQKNWGGMADYQWAHYIGNITKTGWGIVVSFYQGALTKVD